MEVGDNAFGICLPLSFFVFRDNRPISLRNQATNVKIFGSISDLSLHPFRKAPHFYEKRGTFLIEKRHISPRNEALFFFVSILGLFGR
jgi:hypothetical protein